MARSNRTGKQPAGRPPERTTDKAQASIVFPQAEPPGYVPRYIEAKLGLEHARTFAGLKHGLNAIDARLASGKHVESNADVLRYLLDFVAQHSARVGR